MKIITLCLATVFAGLAAGSALAAEGKLNFIGKVVNASCKLEGGATAGSSASVWALFRCRD